MLNIQLVWWLLLLCAPNIAFANEIQPCDKQSGRQCTILKGVAVDFPAPSWFPDGEAFLSTPTMAAEADIRETVLYLHPGESSQDWSRAFTLSGFDLRDHSVNGKAVSHLGIVAAHVALITKQCADGRVYSKKLVETGSELNFILFCEAGRMPDGQAGYDAEHGVIGLYSILTYLGRVVSVSQEWRGVRFNVRNRTSWPVPAAELELMQARLATIRVLGSARPK